MDASIGVANARMMLFDDGLACLVATPVEHTLTDRPTPLVVVVAVVPLIQVEGLLGEV